MSNTAQPGGMASRATARVSAPASSFCAITAPAGSTSLSPAFAISCRASSTRSSSTSELPVSRPMRPEEGAGHGAAEQDGVDLGQQRLDQIDLAADLGAAEHRDERALRLVQRLAEIAQLLLHEEARDRRLEQARHGLGARVGAMRRAEGVVHVEIAEGGEALGQRARRSSPRPDRTGCSRRRPRRRAAAAAWPSPPRREVGSARKVTGAPEQPLELADHRLHGVLRDRARPWGARGGTAAPAGRPCSRRYLMVGSAARIRVLSVTTPSLIGQLKSTRTSARLPSMRRRVERFERPLHSRCPT